MRTCVLVPRVGSISITKWIRFINSSAVVVPVVSNKHHVVETRLAAAADEGVAPNHSDTAPNQNSSKYNLVIINEIVLVNFKAAETTLAAAFSAMPADVSSLNGVVTKDYASATSAIDCAAFSLVKECAVFDIDSALSAKMQRVFKRAVTPTAGVAVPVSVIDVDALPERATQMVNAFKITMVNDAPKIVFEINTA